MTVAPASKPVRFHRDPIRVMTVLVFLNVSGFTLIDPVIPSLVGRYVSDTRIALFVGLVVSAFAVCEFIAAPILGFLSDRLGRKPVLLGSLCGSAVGYLVFGTGGALWVLFLGRIIDGLSAGNISTMYACVADVTRPEDRGRIYGLLGAVGGAGFMLGPVAGGMLGELAPTAPPFAAAALTGVNIAWVAFAVPETLAQEKRKQRQPISDLNPFSQFSFVFGNGALRFILVPAFLFCLAGAMMQSNITVFLTDALGFGPLGIGLVLFLVGMLDILSQGVLTRLLLPRFREIRLARMGLVLNAAGFAALACVASSPHVALLIGAIFLFTLGDGLFQPSSSALVANAAPADALGRVQGANQGLQSVARMTGPLLAAALSTIGSAAIYWTGAAVVAMALLSLVSARGIGR